MNKAFAQNFAQEWVAAWNSHDIDKILSHYAGDFEMTSPVIKNITNEASGMLRGIPAMRDYWIRALKENPNLHFEIIAVFCGVNSVVVHYRGHRGLSAEFFCFNADGKVINASAHYETL